MFDVKHSWLLCCGCDNQLSSGGTFCRFAELIGSIETVAVLSRWCGAWVVLAVRLRRCRRTGGFQDILQDFYVRSNVCLSWSIAYSDPIRFRGVCALVMYVFQTRQSELPLYALGRVMFELGMGFCLDQKRGCIYCEDGSESKSGFCVCMRACLLTPSVCRGRFA